MSLYLFAIPKRKQNVLWKRHDKEKFFKSDEDRRCKQSPQHKKYADLVTFTEEILNGNLHFCAVPRVYEQRM